MLETDDDDVKEREKQAKSLPVEKDKRMPGNCAASTAVRDERLVAFGKGTATNTDVPVVDHKSNPVVVQVVSNFVCLLLFPRHALIGKWVVDCDTLSRFLVLNRQK